MMTLKLETPIRETSHGLDITVFNSDTKFIGRYINKNGDAFALPVTPQALYYIRVDLSKVSMKKPHYRVNVSFK